MTETIEKITTAAKEIAAQPPREGSFTKAIEYQTGKIPSVAFLTLGVMSIITSAGLALAGERYRKSANFIGLWAPTFLILGVYNKLVKLHGSDQFDNLKD